MKGGKEVRTDPMDERISITLDRLRQAGMDVGFTLVAHRGDRQLELIGAEGPGGDRVRITLETQFVHGEGRVILIIRPTKHPKKGDPPWTRREIVIRGWTDRDEYEPGRLAMLHIVREALAEGAK